MLAALAALTACTDAVSLEPGCGNFVLEANEECDRPFNCNACRIPCVERDVDGNVPLACEEPGSIEGECCDRGEVCGPADLMCHAPSGDFGAVDVKTTVNPVRYQVGRVDPDGYGDVVAVASGSLVTLFGDAAAASPLELKETVAAPFPTGRSAIGNFTKDASSGAIDPYVDVVIPSAAGLVTFENRDGAGMSQVVFPALIDETRFQGAVGAIPRSASIPGGVARLTKSAANDLTIELDFGVPGPTPTPKSPCGVVLAANERVVGGLHPYTELAAVLVPVLISRNQDNRSPLLCLETANDSIVRTTEALPATIRSAGGEVFLADVVGNDNCPDLMIPAFDPMNQLPLTYVRAGFVNNGCKISSSLFGAVPGVALGHVKRGARSALITSAGVFDVQTSPTVPILPAARRWVSAATGDFDADGFADFAVSSSEGDDIEVFEQRGANWRSLRVPQTGTFGHLIAGDFDGDRFSDLAYATEASASLTHINVAYGSPHTLSEPILSISFDSFVALSAALLTDPSALPGTDVYDDLVVAHGDIGAANPGRISFVYGSSNRQLAAPWRQACLTRALSVLLGRYDDGAPGLFALFGPQVGNATPTSNCKLVNAFGLRRDTHTFAAATTFETGYLTPVDVEHFIFDTVPFGARDLALGLRRIAFTNVEIEMIGMGFLPAVPPETIMPSCAVYAWSDGLVADHTECTSIADPNGPSDALDALERVTDVKADVDRDVPTIVVIGDGNNTEVEDLVTYEWRIELAPPRPQGMMGLPKREDNIRLVEPINLRAEVAAKLGVSPARVVCFESTFAELGQHEKLGDGKELILACVVRSSTGPTQVQLFARFVNNGDRSNAVIVPITPVVGQAFVDIEAGDVTGDGLDDIVTISRSGEIKLFVQRSL